LIKGLEDAFGLAAHGSGSSAAVTISSIIVCKVEAYWVLASDD
jgi:hypothetical protein